MTISSDTITKLMPALLAAQGEFMPAVKGALNPAFKSKYADLGAVIDAVEPALRKHKIAVVQPTRIEDGRIVLVTRLIHESGEWIGSEYPVNPVQQTPQGEGSALTYARRYSLLALAGIAPEDDDGNAASAPARTQNRPDPRLPLFAEIKKLGHGKGMSDGDIAADFASWSQGGVIGDADRTTLTKYRDSLTGAS